MNYQTLAIEQSAKVGVRLDVPGGKPWIRCLNSAGDLKWLRGWKNAYAYVAGLPTITQKLLFTETKNQEQDVVYDQDDAFVITEETITNEGDWTADDWDYDVAQCQAYVLAEKEAEKEVSRIGQHFRCFATRQDRGQVYLQYAGMNGGMEQEWHDDFSSALKSVRAERQRILDSWPGYKI